MAARMTKKATKKTEKKSGLGGVLKKAKARLPKDRNQLREPLWKGPCVEGVTQSMLNKFLCCPERFYLNIIEGLGEPDRFNHRLEFGNMWHLCEETIENETHWSETLRNYAADLCEKYRSQQEQINLWYDVILRQFPIYVKYWEKHPDVKKKIPLYKEQVFCVPYRLPDGRTVLLRGKWDAVDRLKEKKVSGIYLQENKTKGDINEEDLKKQLTFDLQTMLYIVALETDPGVVITDPVAGVRYNVIRRPLSGGKYSIRQRQPSASNPRGESLDEYCDRLGDLIAEDPQYFFMRWRVEVSPDDVTKFKEQFLTPILTRLCDWYEWVTTANNRWSPENRIHYRTPFGIYNVITEGGKTPLDYYLETGSEVGLVRNTALFTELQ